MTSYIWQRPDWPAFHWDIEALLHTLSEARKEQGRMMQQIHSLGFELAKESQAEILIEETAKTAAIEGEQLDRHAIRSSVAKRLGLPTAGLPKLDRSIDGLVDVLQNATQKYELPLTAKRLKSWQAALFPTGYSALQKIRTGQWRGPDPMRVVSGPMGQEKVHYEAPPHRRLSKEMKLFLDWWNKGSKKMDGLLRSGLAHFYFVTIHPFEDGNGRLARALTDMALAQDDKVKQRFYSLSIRIMADRNQYYDTLERCQKDTLDITPWFAWFLQCFRSALKDSEILIMKSLRKGQFWQTHATKNLNERQRKVLNKLLDAGPGGFIGGMTTRKYSSMTGASRATAFRELTALLEQGLLQTLEGRGRSTAYELRI